MFYHVITASALFRVKDDDSDASKDCARSGSPSGGENKEEEGGRGGDGKGREEGV